MGYSEILQLSFGRSKAESEKELLDKYYVTTLAYLNAKNEKRRKLYFIGHRGAGKSALLNQLTNEFKKNNDNIILSIDPTQFSYELFEKRNHNFYDVKTIYGGVWHYTLMMRLFKETVEHFEKHHLSGNKENIEKLKSYLIDKKFLKSDSMLDVFIRYLKKVTVGKISSGGTGIEIRTSGEDEELLKFLNLSEISREIGALKVISAGHPMFIFIDELDTGWNNTREARNFIHGLFYAVEKMRELKNVTLFVSLRSDMYRNLSSVLPDAEKMRDDIQKFNWDKRTLKGLIGQRIKAHWPNSELDEANSKEAISRVFEPGVFDYILSRSLYRPREVIQFCNDVLDKFRSIIHMQKANLSKIPLSVAKSVEPEFSEYRLDDLCKEYEDQYPSLKHLFNEYENEPEYYNYNDFKEKTENVLLEVSFKKKNTAWLNDYIDNIADLVRLLFDIGFIMVYSKREKAYLGYYETSIRNIENINKLKIHNAFVANLKCYSE